ncbi:22591_t:CDS:2 [Rhizophagus irregularis]|nr:22591_t:CDS:2 [Rhizophagus irregularis]
MDKEDANAQKTPDDRFFYLDVSIPFDTSNLPWRAIPDNAKNLPLESLSSIFTGGLAASVGGVKNETIFFLNNEKDNTTSPVHSYNSLNNVWNTQNLSGVRPIGRNQMRAITDNNGKIYLLTGFDFTAQEVNRANGLFICDTINLNCVIKDAPLSRLGYGVTLLPNGNLVYMGGGDRNYVPISDGFKVIYLYDPINDKWDSKVTTGNIPPADVGITTVLGLSGDKIILFGGNNGDNNNLYVLDTTNYEWYVPEVRGKSPVFKRGEHCANVIGKYMVVTFGKPKYRTVGESDVLLLDISSESEYIWTTSFDPSSLTNNSTSSVSLPSLPRRKRNANVIPTPGDDYALHHDKSKL